ncbi:hypothetical protein AZSP09_36300 (plasmid) [Azospira sp. I09]|nr:hypothetical protein AZSP09_36300 [Azospira sp. I09]
MGPMTVSVVECPEERVEVFGIHAAKATEQHGAFLNLLGRLRWPKLLAAECPQKTVMRGIAA